MKDILVCDTHKNKPRQVPGGPYLVRMLHTIAELGLLPGVRKAPKYGPISVGGVGDISDFCKKYSCKNVLIVGSNPSNLSPDTTAFHPDTKSRQFVDKWFEGEGWTVVYENLVDIKIPGNKPLSVQMIKAHLPWICENIGAYNKMGYKIVACGKIAARGLRLAGATYFEMPHPSGMCRFWNDKEAGKVKVEEMKVWLLNTHFLKGKK